MFDAQTAADLRNAALVMGAAGLARREYVDKANHVCLEGAIRLATTITSGWHEVTRLDRLAGGYHQGRKDQAVDAVGGLLPEECPCGEHCDSALNGRVYHFNDEHCTGAGEAVELLIQAAEKIEADLP